MPARIENRVKEIREAKQLTIEELSESTNVSTARLKRFENGQPVRIMVDEAYRIAKCLGVDITDLA